MKSPADLADRLRRQWGFAENRERRLLHSDAWPITLSIGKPTAFQFTNQTASVREHLHRWRAVASGEVIWERVNYRGGMEPVSVPVSWRISSAAEWIAAMGIHDIEREYQRLQRLLRGVDSVFQVAVARNRSSIRDKSEAEILKAATLAMRLEPGCADGRPLRALAGVGTDTKFLERHRSMMVEFLDARFAGEVSDLGLEGFLGAPVEADHWVLLVPLQAGILPFAQLRVRTSELESTPLNYSNVLIVENESSLHQVPPLRDTITVLGCGLDLEWLRADWLRLKRVAYWGDLDTWGLQMLARVRLHQPDVSALLMSTGVFDEYSARFAVPEPITAAESVPATLHPQEQELYIQLRGAAQGRLEQELLPVHVVAAALEKWHGEI